MSDQNTAPAGGTERLTGYDGDWIRTARESCGMTTDELARTCVIDEGYLLAMERGTATPPSIFLVDSLRRVLGLHDPMSGTRTPGKTAGEILNEVLWRIPWSDVGPKSRERYERDMREILSRFRACWACDGAGEISAHWNDPGGDCPSCGGIGLVAREDGE